MGSLKKAIIKATSAPYISKCNKKNIKKKNVRVLVHGTWVKASKDFSGIVHGIEKNLNKQKDT